MHELPHAGRSHAGNRHRIQGRLDDGHVLEFQGKAILAEGFLKDGHVVLREAEDLAHAGRHLLGVEDHVVLHGLVVGQLDERIHLLQPLDEDPVRDLRGEMDTVHVILALGVLTDLAVQVPDAQEAVGHVVRIVEAALLVLDIVSAAVERAIEIIDGRAHPGGFLDAVPAIQAVHLPLEAVAFLGVRLEGFQLLLDLFQAQPQLEVLLFQLLTRFPVQLYARRGRKRGKEEEGRT